MNRIHYVDVGARGDLTEPWSEHEQDLVVYGFEADPVEHNRLNSLYPNRHYYPVALSSKKGEITLKITEQPSQSSMYPQNDNSMFEDQHWQTRHTIKEVVMPSATLDESLSGACVDAIKIDTQGAEYEILKGGEVLLSHQKPFLFLETWSYPVYEGAPLMQDILQLLYPLGYELWAIEAAAAWRYKIINDELQMAGVRQRLIGLNLMLVPSLDQLKLLAPERVKSRVKMLRWYGFLDAAYLLAEHIDDAGLMRSIADQVRREASLPFRVRNKLKRVFSKTRRYPPIT